MGRNPFCLSLKVGDQIVATGQSWGGDHFSVIGYITATFEEQVCFDFKDKDGVSQGCWVPKTKDGEYFTKDGVGGSFWVRLTPCPTSVEYILNLEKEVNDGR